MKTGHHCQIYFKDIPEEVLTLLKMPERSVGHTKGMITTVWKEYASLFIHTLLFSFFCTQK
jgi:hypothetical protein